MDLSGQWIVTVSALLPACEPLPEPARSRQFVASIAHAGSQLAVLPSSPTLAVGDEQRGRIFGSAVALTIPYWLGDISDSPYYGLLDALQPTGLLGIWGTIKATVEGEGVSGVLDGGLHYYPGALAVDAHRGCEGRSAVVHLRRQ